MEFGTGAVKITPAHDFNDFEVGVRHNLKLINILNDDGTLNENAGKKFQVRSPIFCHCTLWSLLQGMPRFFARRAVVEALKAEGLYVETKDNPMDIPVCS